MNMNSDMVKNNTFINITILLLFTFLSFFFTYPLISDLSGSTLDYRFPRGHHDWWLYTWLLNYGPEILGKLSHNELMTGRLFYPAGYPIEQTIQGAPAIITAYPLIKLFTLPTVSNLLILISLIIISFLTFKLVNHLISHTFAAFISSAAFTFSPIVIAQAKSHFLILFSLFAIPFYIFMLLKLHEKPGIKTSIYFSLSIVLLFISYYYYPIFCAIITFLFFLSALNDKTITPEFLAWLLISVLSALPFILLLLIPMFTAAYLNPFLDLTINYAKNESVDFLAFFVPDIDHFALGKYASGLRRRFMNNDALQSAYIGWSLLLIIAAGIIRSKPDRKEIFWYCGAVVFFLLSLGPTLNIYGIATSIPMPYRLFEILPVINNVSDCSIFALVFMLFTAVILGFVLKRLCMRFNGKRGRHYFLSVIFLLISLDFAGIPIKTMDLSVPAIYNKIRQDDADVSVIELPLRHDIRSYLYFQTVHNKDMVNGGPIRRYESEYEKYGNNFQIIRELRSIADNDRFQNENIADEEIEYFIAFFKIGYVVVHKDLLKSEKIIAMHREYLERSIRLIPYYEDSNIIAYKIPHTAEAGKNIVYDVHPSHKNSRVLLKGFSEPYKDNEDNGWIDIISKNPLMIFYLPEKKNLIFTAKLCSEYYSDADNAKKGLNIIINGNLVNANIDGACGKVEYNVTADLTKKGLNKFEFLFEHNIIKYKTRIAYLSFKPI